MARNSRGVGDVKDLFGNRHLNPNDVCTILLLSQELGRHQPPTPCASYILLSCLLLCQHTGQEFGCRKCQQGSWCPDVTECGLYWFNPGRYHSAQSDIAAAKAGRTIDRRICLGADSDCRAFKPAASASRHSPLSDARYGSMTVIYGTWSCSLAVATGFQSL